MYNSVLTGDSSENRPNMTEVTFSSGRNYPALSRHPRLGGA
jgi:hypothetical protein